MKSITLICIYLSLGIVPAFKQYYVIPNGYKEMDCPKNDTCKYLSEYVRNSSNYFTSDTKIIFKSGTHELRESLFVEKVKNLNFIGPLDGTAMIKCEQKNPWAITFQKCSHIQISNLTIMSCGHQKRMQNNTALKHKFSLHKCYTNKHDIYSAIYFDSVNSIYLYNISIKNTNGYGAFLRMVRGQIIILSSLFSNNTGNENYTGGNLYVLLDKQCLENNRKMNLTISASTFSDGRTTYHYKKKGIPASGIHICSYCPVSYIKINKCNISNNLGGNIYIFMMNYVKYYWRVNITNSLITNGEAYEGAGIEFIFKLYQLEYKRCDNLSHTFNSFLVRRTSFINNTAHYSGGAIKIQLTESDCKPSKVELSMCILSSNSISSEFSPGAALRVMTHRIPEFEQFQVVRHLVTLKNVIFQNHNLLNKTYPSTVKVEHFFNLTFEDCAFLNNNATALDLEASLVIFVGTVKFENNSARNGAAIKLCESSSFFINNESTILFINNYAERTGGAIYVQESCIGQYGACFFQPNVNNITRVDQLNMNLTFMHNTAGEAGNALYGGSIARCLTYKQFIYNDRDGFDFGFKIFSTIFHFDSSMWREYISSDAFQVEFCSSNSSPFNVSVIPGKIFSMLVKSVGQLNGASKGVITAEFNQSYKDASVTPVEFYQPTTHCYNLSLRFASSNPEKRYTIILKVQQNQPEFIYRTRMYKYVDILIDACPWGFHLNTSSGMCACHIFLVNKGILCFLDDETLLKGSFDRVWVGCNLTQESCIRSHLLYSTCGLPQYCNNNKNNVTADNTSSQCVQGRTGIACGVCKTNLSAVLGSSICKLCPNNHLWLILVFLAAGISLILLIALLDITVANGTIYGMLFYISFIQLNQSFLLYDSDLNISKAYYVYNAFVSWLNLDFGIEACFFSGMTTYHKIWLEFGFIFYIWVLEMSIVYLCRKFVFFTRICGKNISKVLATVLYMTIQKCSKLIFQCICYKTVYNIIGNSQTRVWPPQTSIKHLSLEHLPLFLFSLLVLILILMFVCSLLFIQFLRKVSYLKVVNRLLPFFETFTGPCNDSHAFWPGLLIFIQGVFQLLIVGFNYNSNLVTLMTAFASFTVIVLSFFGPHRVYKNWSLNFLELSYTINLLVLSMIISIKYDHGQSNIRYFMSSLCLAIVCFVLYHFKSKLRKIILLGCSYVLRHLNIFKITKINSLINVTRSSEMLEGLDSEEETSTLLSSELPRPNFWQYK